MVEIRLINDKELWNEQLLKTINYNIFSSYEWGEYKSKQWSILRIAFYKDEKFIGQTQFCMKYLGKWSFAWNSGGINLVNFIYIDKIIESIKLYFVEKKYNFRFNFYDINESYKNFEISRKLVKCPKTINSGFSVLHDLSQEQDLSKSLNTNHRYYYKKSLKNNFSIKYGSFEYIDDFTKLHQNMVDNKKLSQLSVSKKSIVDLHSCFKDNFVIFSIYLEKEMISSCLVLIYGDYAFYYLAASSEEGRRTYSSFLMVVELLEFLKNKGIKRFDFGGITPYDSNADGVNRFKLGFGGNIINYLGEWEISNSKMLSCLINRFYL